MDVVHSIAQFMRPYLGEIAISLVACILVIAGGDINRYLRVLLRGHNFLVRTLVFVLLNAFGYGLVIVHVSPMLASSLAQLDANWLVSVVSVSFILIGLWAQRNKQV
jgi:hypothetical protein